jgi:hypothetical protein
MRTLTLCAVMLGAAGTARALEVVHEPLSCVPAGRYARIVARGVPAEGVASAEAQFRTGPDAGWYRVRLDADGDAWQGFLPQPTAALARFEYRVVLFAPDASQRETEPAVVTVAPTAAGCPAGDASAAAASIVLQVPAGAPLVPPVPMGFSPVGAMLPQAAQRLAPRPVKGGAGTRLALGVGLAGLAGGAVTALGQRSGDAIAPPPEDPGQRLPTFSFTGSVPSAGATLSLARDQLRVTVSMDREPAEPMPVQFTVGLQRDTGVSISSRCAAMTGSFDAVQRPLALVLTGPVVLGAGAPCGEQFEVRALFVQVSMGARQVMQGTVPLTPPLRVEP